MILKLREEGKTFTTITNEFNSRFRTHVTSNYIIQRYERLRPAKEAVEKVCPLESLFQTRMPSNFDKRVKLKDSVTGVNLEPALIWKGSCAEPWFTLICPITRRREERKQEELQSGLMEEWGMSIQF